MRTTPRHWSGKRRILGVPRANGRTQLDATLAVALDKALADATMWHPQPLPEQLGDQARRELDAMAAARRQDAWSGTRDTDRGL